MIEDANVVLNSSTFAACTSAVCEICDELTMVNNAALDVVSAAVVSAATATVDPASPPASVSSSVVASSAAVLATAVVSADVEIASALAAEVVDGATIASVPAAAGNLRFVVDGGCDGVTGTGEA